MIANIDRPPASRQFVREAGGWITCRITQPEFGVNQLDRLSAPAKPHAGNLRLAIDGQHVYLIAELHDVDGILTFDEAQNRLFSTTHQPADDMSPIDVAMALAEAGDGWSWSEVQPGHWQAVADDSRHARCELTAAMTDGGVEICGRLADWETALSETSQAAIGQFFAAAHARVRFVRFTLQDRQATACSFAAVDRLDVEVRDSVDSVRAACRLVSREVRALADAAVARQFLDCTR